MKSIVHYFNLASEQNKDEFARTHAETHAGMVNAEVFRPDFNTRLVLDGDDLRDFKKDVDKRTDELTPKFLKTVKSLPGAVARYFNLNYPQGYRQIAQQQVLPTYVKKATVVDLSA